MKAIRLSFQQMLLFVRRDKMLAVSCFVPFLAGLFFKAVIPAIERAAVGWSGKGAVISPYYGLIDVLFSMLTPTMLCFAAAMVILEEHDDRIDGYLFVTTLGRKGYLVSRLGIPAFIALIATLILLPIFKLTPLSVFQVAFLSIMGALQGILIALLIVTLSTNKLEGMAVTKIAALTMLGALVPYVTTHQIQWACFFLPSFWVGKAIARGKPVFMLAAILTICVWLLLLMKKYLKKLT